ncbi:MAG: 30S ribosomal protein S12 methylthiotransferase RimO [Clostridia bacterium]
MKKILIVTLGCPKNLVDSEIIAQALIDRGYEPTTIKEKAQVAVVNTCAFIEPAVTEAIEAILDIARMKKEGVLEQLVVTGCLVQRYKEEILREIPEIDYTVGIDFIKDIPAIIETGEKKNFMGESRDIGFLNMERALCSPHKSAYLKISDGCSNHCTYCTIPAIRGEYRSRTMEDILSEALVLAGKGIKELILVAQDTTYYGYDLYREFRLEALLRALSGIEGIRWIRLLYCYPENITEGLIREMAGNKKVLKYLDIPFQHASADVLRRMGRKSGPKEYGGLIRKLRENISGLVIRTTFITGFPGETEEDFNILMDFIRESSFDHVGVFPYYREEGTPAYRMKDQVPAKVKEQRKEQILALQTQLSMEKNIARLGGNYDIIIESVSDDGLFYEGRSYMQAPEIDGVTYVASREPLGIGDIVPVKLLNIHEHSFIGEAQI